jgi:hypothetical protein
LISIVSSLQINAEDIGNLKKLVGTVDTINMSGNELYVVRDGEQVASLTKVASDPEKVCHVMRAGAAKSVNLEKSGGDIPGENLAALAVVLAYRAAHTWPFSVPDVTSPSTKIEVRTLKWAFEEHPYYFVAIVGAPKPLTLGCGAEEYYRVSPENFEVLSYQGCPDNSSTVLRRLQQLPP